jgi:predicted HAD superfamily Cof-like phosphohydrolase
MALPWLAVGKLVLSNLDTIIDVVKPVFTRKKIEAVPNQADLLNQQISELQTASSNNAEQIKELAAQLKQMVTALDQAALNVAAERKKTRILSIIAVTVSVIAIITATASIVAR